MPYTAKESKELEKAQELGIIIDIEYMNGADRGIIYRARFSEEFKDKASAICVEEGYSPIVAIVLTLGIYGLDAHAFTMKSLNNWASLLNGRWVVNYQIKKNQNDIYRTEKYKNQFNSFVDECTYKFEQMMQNAKKEFESLT